MSFTSGPNPFLPSPHGHPDFNPVCLGAKAPSMVDPRNLKQPKPPDKPLTPYIRYSQKVWEQVKTQHQDLKSWEIGRLIGQMWRELSDEGKKEHTDDYEAEKVKYNEALKNYQNSPAYQNWLAAKAKAKAEASKLEGEGKKKSQEERDALERCATASLLSPQKPNEEEDEAEQFAQKNAALTRYVRNHRLINEIFNETVVPDVRSVVTADRMNVLKRQVQSLTMHQKKLEAELAEIEKFEIKKRKFVEDSAAFQEELKKMREQSKEVEEMLHSSDRGGHNPHFQKMVEQAKEQLMMEASKRLQAEMQPKVAMEPMLPSGVPPPSFITTNGNISSPSQDSNESSRSAIDASSPFAKDADTAVKDE